jgi:hypothetical protein
VTRFRRGISVGTALTLLLLTAPVGSAAAAPEDPPASQQGQGEEQRADAAQQRPRKKPVEPKGNPASPAAMRAGRLSCGDVITKSTTLVADIGPCPADGIIIGADNIRLNLNGHRIFGEPGVGDGNAAGIRLPFRTGATITGHPGNSGKKGTVTGFDAGVFINGGSGNTIENLVVSENVGPDGSEEPLLGDGIVLFHSGNNRIVNNMVTHNGPYDGIGVLGSDSNDNLVQGNIVEDTPASERTPFVGITDGVGILINNFLDEQGTPRRGEPIFRNQVIDNVVRRNDNSGISNVTHVDGRIEGNIVEDNGALGEVCESQPSRDGSEGPIVCRPAADPSNGIGVTKGPGATGVAADGVTRMLIRDNRVTGNTGDGIAIGAFPEFTHVSENRIVENVATGNGGSGNVFRGPFDGPRGRYDLHDYSRSQPCGDDTCPPEPSCDANVWRDNVFNTAYPPCAAGGLAMAEGPLGDPTCSDGRDNDLDGAIDGGDPDCIPLPPPPDSGGGGGRR